MHFRGIHIITGTSAGVGKTTVTAAFVAQAMAAGEDPIVVKLAQTGEPEGRGALENIRELTGCGNLHEFARYPDELPPAYAARRAGLPELDLKETAERLRDLAADGQPVFVEGTGGVLVRIANWSIAELASELGAPVTVVASTVPGTLNNTELAVEACRARGLEVSGVVVAEVPAERDLATECVIENMPLLTTAPVLATIPEEAGRMSREDFLGRAAGWFTGARASLD